MPPAQDYHLETGANAGGWKRGFIGVTVWGMRWKSQYPVAVDRNELRKMRIMIGRFEN
ncbi:hypothetical protein [Algoriphagus sp. NG3]|uniref:hypothetical protein n=1 Tax=Algoriphagus sp. NG3 TaxID=3097546 RepID=UPI002A828AB0|nr:hypothetical protein [Algoriphagus sp. NG3]WPR75236.1 hypothetical protein SLW71_21475 [Algoriphagus sp. NG3]